MLSSVTGNVSRSVNRSITDKAKWKVGVGGEGIMWNGSVLMWNGNFLTWNGR